MKKRWKVLIGMIVLVFVLAACAKEADTYKEGYLGDAAIEQDGTFDQIGTAEEGWEDAREQALKEATSGGQKAPAEAFDRAKAEEVVRLVNEERKRLGLNELVIDEAMMTAAETRAKEQKTLFSHTRPDGTKCFTVFDQFEIPANSTAEVYSADIMGARAVRINLGDSKQILESGDTLGAAIQPDMISTVMGQIEPLKEQAMELMATINPLESTARRYMAHLSAAPVSKTSSVQCWR